MKKFYNLFFTMLMVFSVVNLFGQSNRMVLIEEGTQASCGPCAGQNPGLDALIDANVGKAILIRYQVSWPGFDQMNLDNPQEPMDRVQTYYGIGGVPTARLSGMDFANDCGAWDGAPACIDQSEVDEIANQMSEFDIDITSAEYDYGNHTVRVSGTVTATTAATGNFVLRISALEKEISAEQAPGGTNGETHYRHVHKKFVNNSSAGTTMSASWAMGDVYEFNYEVEMGTIPVYNPGDMEIVAFVQDDNTKFVHQAALVDAPVTNIPFANNSALLDVSGPTVVCSGTQTVSPVIRVENQGSATMTSADIVYSVNNGAEQTMNWTGSLSSFESANVTLDPITFEADLANTVSVLVTNVNGGDDEDVTNNDGGYTLLGSQLEGIGTDLTLTIQLDAYPTETSWDMKNGAGVVIASGAGYTAANTIVTENISVDPDCVNLTFYDSYGDGFYATQWGQPLDGYYQLTNELGELIVEGGYQEEYAANSDAMSMSPISSIEDIEALASLSVFPNPTSTDINVAFDLDQASNVRFELFNILGERVMVKNAQDYIGSNQVSFDTAQLGTGIYTLTMDVEGQVVSTKVSVIK